MTLARVATLVGCALGVMGANVAVTILYMIVYSHVIDVGHEKAYYEAHVQIAAPYCSIVAGMPLMFVVGVWVGGFRDVTLAVPSAFVIWLTYAVVDLTILAVSGLTLRIGLLAAVSLLTKLAAVYGGALVGGRGGG